MSHFAKQVLHDPSFQGCLSRGFATAHAGSPQALSKSLFSNNDLHTEPVAAIQAAIRCRDCIAPELEKSKKLGTTIGYGSIDEAFGNTIATT